MYVKSLSLFYLDADKPNSKLCRFQRQWSYPLPDFGGLYTPNALVIRSSESTGYAYLDNPKRMSFIAVAAYRGPPLEEVNGEMVIASKKIVAGTKRKIATILNMALENGHDSVVLSALGCGAYGMLAPILVKMPQNHLMRFLIS
jgi:uncharacterized protein (TIGR02452 family)